MYYKQEMEKILANIDAELAFCQKLFGRMPKGQIHVEHSNGYRIFRRWSKENGKTVRHAINLKPILAKRLLEKEYLKARIELLNENRRALDSILSEFCNDSSDDILKRMRYGTSEIDPCVYMGSNDAGLLIPRPCNSGSIPILPLNISIDSMLPEEWAVLPYRENTSFSESKTHIGTGGLRFRSKSEMMIVDMLIRKGIPLHYDEVVTAGGQLISPDALCMRHDRKIIAIEHLGLRNDEYYHNLEKKLMIYRGAGFFPGQNLLFTCDEPDGSIDVIKIEKMVDAYLK